MKAPADVRKIALKVPNEALDMLNISTTNRDITIAPAKVGSVTLGSNGGNVLFEELNVENSVALSAKNGNISGTIVGGFDDCSISCSIKKGESSLPAEKKSGAKKLTVSMNNGDVDVDFV